MKNNIIKFVIDIFDEKLIVLFDKFKVSSPKVALLIYALIGGIVKGANVILATPEASTIFGSYTGTLNTGIMALGMVFAALTSAHTVGPKHPTGDIKVPATTPVYPLPTVPVVTQKGSIEDMLRSSTLSPGIASNSLVYPGGNTTAHTLGNTGIGGTATIGVKGHEELKKSLITADPIKKKKHKYHTPKTDAKKD